MKGKWVFGTLTVCLLAVACIEQQKRVIQSVSISSSSSDNALEDSLATDADTLLLDEEFSDEPLPSNVDEVFDDFLFLFEHSNRFQRHRVRFPLPITDAEGNRQELNRNQWTHHSMSLGQEFCTVLWNYRRQIDLSMDENQQQARVEHIYLHSRIVESFGFERDSLSGEWNLISQSSIPFDEYPQSDFLDFYRDFATDSAFQRRHVHDPLRFTMASEDSEEEPIEGTIDVDQWFEFAPELPKAVLVNIQYGQQFSNPNRMVMQMRGFSDSMQNIFVFQRNANGRWRLTEFEN